MVPEGCARHTASSLCPGWGCPHVTVRGWIWGALLTCTLGCSLGCSVEAHRLLAVQGDLSSHGVGLRASGNPALPHHLMWAPTLGNRAKWRGHRWAQPPRAQDGRRWQVCCLPVPWGCRGLPRAPLGAGCVVARCRQAPLHWAGLKIAGGMAGQGPPVGGPWGGAGRGSGRPAAWAPGPAVNGAGAPTLFPVAGQPRPS